MFFPRIDIVQYILWHGSIFRNDAIGGNIGETFSKKSIFKRGFSQSYYTGSYQVNSNSTHVVSLMLISLWQDNWLGESAVSELLMNSREGWEDQACSCVLE